MLPRRGVKHQPGSQGRVPHGTAAPRPARASPHRRAAFSGAEHYHSRHAVSWTAETRRRSPALGPAPLSRPVPAGGRAARGVGTRAMEESSTPLVGCSKPHLEKLTLGITRILESSPGVTEVTIIEKAPAERHMISSWEQVSVALFNPHLPAKRSQLQCP